MKRIKRSGFLLVLTLLLSPILVYSSPAGPPEGLDVKVINEATEPVPVTGEVTATVSGDVNVVNTPGVVVENIDPISVQDNNRPKLITTSTVIGINMGDTQGENDVVLPSCPEGERFLVSGLYAAPSTFAGDFPDSVSLPAWVVTIRNVAQLDQSGFLVVRLTIASEGHLHGSATIPGGQAVLDTTSTFLDAKLAAPATSNISFHAHVTGFCGTPFIP